MEIEKKPAKPTKHIKVIVGVERGAKDPVKKNCHATRT